MSMHHLAEHLDADDHDTGSNSPLELGVQFRSDSSVTSPVFAFTKCRQHRTHIGNLWNGLGTLLASATSLERALRAGSR